MKRRHKNKSKIENTHTVRCKIACHASDPVYSNQIAALTLHLCHNQSSLMWGADYIFVNTRAHDATPRFVGQDIVVAMPIAKIYRTSKLQRIFRTKLRIFWEYFEIRF